MEKKKSMKGITNLDKIRMKEEKKEAIYNLIKLYNTKHKIPLTIYQITLITEIPFNTVKSYLRELVQENKLTIEKKSYYFIVKE
ncbi:hypothetical protein M2325_000717 [Methanococcus voltae PS]|uniref:Uncharacterized protein n=1 Tax=Methanococcus voltae PS TaxID=523842 RepID=A0ABT2EVS3_METVO|nr:hypothetical protein [Methanococcus voltae]MCS3922032.1 hypothetical protein [Methanococcus voltae PS]